MAIKKFTAKKADLLASKWRDPETFPDVLSDIRKSARLGIRNYGFEVRQKSLRKFEKIARRLNELGYSANISHYGSRVYLDIEW